MTTPDDNQALAALYAVTLNLLLAGLRNDGTLAAEIERIFHHAEPKVAQGVMSLMVAAASNDYETRHGSRDAAIEVVELELAAILTEIPGSET